MLNKLKAIAHHPLRAKLIFNAGSGRPEDSPQKLVSILAEVQSHQILPEVYVVNLHSKLETMVHMPVIADGVPMSEGSLSIHIQPCALKMMASAELTGRPTSNDVTVVTISELAPIE